MTALEEGYEVKRFIEASPQFKTINVYNEHQHRAMRETILRYGVKLGDPPKQQVSTPEKQPDQKQSRRKGLSR